jgi:hypothetical protein
MQERFEEVTEGLRQEIYCVERDTGNWPKAKPVVQMGRREETGATAVSLTAGIQYTGHYSNRHKDLAPKSLS